MKLYTVAHEYKADVTDYYEVEAESRGEAAAFVENGDGEYVNNECMEQCDGHYYVIDSKEIKS